MRLRSGWVTEPGPVGVAEAEVVDGLACGDLFEPVAELLSDREEESVAAVEVVVAAHRLGRQPLAHVAWDTVRGRSGA